MYRARLYRSGNTCADGRRQRRKGEDISAGNCRQVFDGGSDNERFPAGIKMGVGGDGERTVVQLLIAI